MFDIAQNLAERSSGMEFDFIPDLLPHFQVSTLMLNIWNAIARFMKRKIDVLGQVLLHVRADQKDFFLSIFSRTPSRLAYAVPRETEDRR